MKKKGRFILVQGSIFLFQGRNLHFTMFVDTTWQVVSSVVRVLGLVNYLGVIIVSSTHIIIRMKS
jgi:hypothetical protein